MYQFFEQTMEKCPTTLFLVREKITFQDFPKLVRARATTLKKLGVQYGDTLGVLAHNIPQFPLTLFAIWYLGATVLMLDTNLTPFEYDNMTKVADCHFVCAEPSFFYETSQFKFLDITASDGGVDPKLYPYPLKDCEVASMSFTSGSTSNPRVVPLTHYNLVECANSLEDMAEYC